MKYDCGFEKGNNWFRYRAGGIVIHNGKMLFVKSAIGGYYYMVGGGVHLGETSENCIEREIFEEAGIHTRVHHLAVVCENFFKGNGGKIDGLDCHTIEFYYLMDILDDDLSLCRNMTDEGESLVWLPIAQIKQSNIKPEFIKEYISEIINQSQIPSPKRAGDLPPRACSDGANAFAPSSLCLRANKTIHIIEERDR